MSFEEVAAHLTSNNTPAVEKQLQTLVKDASVINLENNDVIKKLLHSANSNILHLTAQVIAELAKNAKNRTIISHCDVFQPLLQQLQAESGEVVHQALRAIGNICFENETGCSIIGDAGLRTILETIKRFQTKKHQEVVNAGWGVVVNLLTTSEPLAKTSLRRNILDMLENALTKSDEFGDSVVQQALIILNTVTDEVEEAQQQQLKKICYEVIRIMKCTTNLEIGALCLEFLFSQAESRKHLHCVYESMLYSLCFRTI